MRIFDKHGWLNFTMALFGFTFFFSLSTFITGRFFARSITEITALTPSFHWIANGLIAFVLSLVLVIFFCKPRAPFLIAAAILLGGIFSLRPRLFSAIVHLDGNLRQHGLVALHSLLPHLFLVILAVIAYYAAWLSNRSAANRSGR